MSSLVWVELDRAAPERNLKEIRRGSAPGVKAAEESIGITTEYLLNRLHSLVEFNRDDYLSEPDENGERHYTLANVPRDKAGLVAFFRAHNIEGIVWWRREGDDASDKVKITAEALGVERSAK